MQFSEKHTFFHANKSSFYVNFLLSIGGFILNVPQKKSCFRGIQYVMYKEKVCISIDNFINDFKPLIHQNAYNEHIMLMV